MLIIFYLQTKAQTATVSIITPAGNNSNYVYCTDTAYQFSSNPPVLYGYNWYTHPTTTSFSGATQQPLITFHATGTYTLYLQYYTSYSGSGGTTQTILQVDSTGNCKALTGISTATKNSQLNLYPNPAQNSFTIRSSTDEKQTLSLYDITGKQILSQNITGTTTIDVNSLENGIYFVQLKNNVGISTQKIIVQH